jgi:subtilisin family serine protease
MTRRHALVSTMVGAALACASLTLSTVAVQASPLAGSDGGDHRRIVVVYATGVASHGRAEARSRARADKVRALGRPGFELVQLHSGTSMADAITKLRSDPRVLTAVPDQELELSSTPDDPLFDEQWGLRNTGQLVNGSTGIAGADIDATLAWDRTTGSPSVVVADLDTGYRFDHPDLAGVAWTNPGETAGNGVDDDGNGYVDDTRGWDALDHDNDPSVPGLVFSFPGSLGFPVDSHGVHTAGTIGAQGDDGTGVTGVAQDVRLMPLRVCQFDGCTFSAIIEAINYAGRMGARAANLSITGFPTDPATILAMTTALAANPRTLYVAAAGNNGADTDAVGPRALPCAANPAKSDATIAYKAAKGAVDNVLCVAATDQADGLASFSTYGSRSVDLAAPGVNVLSTAFTTDQEFFTDQFDSGGFDAWSTPAPPASAPDQGFTAYALGGGSFTAIASDPPPTLGLPGSQAPGTTRATESPIIEVGPDYTECTVNYVAGATLSGDDSFTWTVSVDGTTVLAEPLSDLNPLTGRNQGRFTIPPGSSGHDVRIGFQFHRGLDGAPAAWGAIRQLRMDCARSSYRFDSGTSMAAPHVTGVAALLFSLRPSATVTDVRKAILKGVEPLASLTLKTVTGGRLNAWRAMDALLPLDTRITAGPSGSVRGSTATFAFDTNGTGNATTFECRLDVGPLVPCSNPVSYSGLKPGKHSFRVRAVLPGGVDSSPAIRDWTVRK